MAIGDKIYDLEINDSEFEREGWKNARYNGSKLIGSKINKFTQGDISFANQPVIEQYSKTVYVFNQARNSFEANAGVFFPEIDEFSQSLDDQAIIGSTQFTLNRAVTFELDNPTNFSQIDAGISEDDANYIYFDRLVKHDLALFNSCSVRFFSPANNGFTKNFYTVGHNKGFFQPAAAHFVSSAADVVNRNDTIMGINFGTQFASIITMLNSGSRLYINPNVEQDYIAISGSTDLPDNVPNDLASGSQGSIEATNNTAITIDHTGSIELINSSKGYFYNLSKKVSPSNPYFISFDRGLQGVGTNIEKNLLKAFDVREIDHSGSNVLSHVDATIKIKDIGKDNGFFTTNYGLDANAPIEETEFILFKRTAANNVIHLDFNFITEAPAGVGNGGVIIPDNLHPKIKESLNVYLSNAGLGAQGGSSATFELGGVTATTKQQIAAGAQPLIPIPTTTTTTTTTTGVTPSGQGQPLPTFTGGTFDFDINPILPPIGTPPIDVNDPTTIPGYGLPDPGNPHTADPIPTELPENEGPKLEQ